MINSIDLIRNIGTFDNVTSNQQSFGSATVIYAENGRGKTTISAILRSLGSNISEYIEERKRLGASRTPHVVVQSSNSHIYQNGAWNSNDNNVLVFDDNFIAENICSGIQIDPRHRQNLHELVIGHQGVALNNLLQQKISEIETHNAQLRIKSAPLQLLLPNGISLDQFISLDNVDNLQEKISAVQKEINAVKQSDSIQNAPLFETINIPDFDIEEINKLLNKGIDDLESDAVVQIQKHISSLNKNAEKWIDEGVDILNETNGNNCPFCTQPLDKVELIKSYQRYFSDEYSSLKNEIITYGRRLQNDHRTEVFTALERQLSTITKRVKFWGSYADIPEIELNSIELIKSWKLIFERIINKLRDKAKAPLEKFSLEDDLVANIEAYKSIRSEILNSVSSTISLNEIVKTIKEKAKGGDLNALNSDLSRLKLIEKRFTEDVITQCNEYIEAKEAKRVTEGERDQARANLDSYRTSIFPTYQTSINAYLQKFNAGFRLEQMTSNNTRSGSSCNYNVLINNVEVSVASQNQGEPSFRSTLSAGDRNTLALAFFFASLEHDPLAHNRILVIDDPMSSLDAHRSLTTIQEIKRIIGTVSQTIILSHSKPFLINLWKELSVPDKKALKIARISNGSDIQDWDVNQDSITEHDRRFDLISGYLQSPNGQSEREVAIALRPTLESFIRVCYPLEFPPGSLLGQFIYTCQTKLGGADEILNSIRTNELRALLDYANKFHHDTNPTYQTEIINDQELSGFAQRVINFIRK